MTNGSTVEKTQKNGLKPDVPDQIQKRRIRHRRAGSVPEAENKLFEIVLTGTATRTTTELTLRLTKGSWPRTIDQLETIDLTVADIPKWITWANLTTIRLVYVSCESEGRRNRLRHGRWLWDWLRKWNVSGLTGTPDDVKYSKARMRCWNGRKLRKRPSALRKLWITFSRRTRTIGGRNPKTRYLWLDLRQCQTAQAVIVRHWTWNSRRKRKIASVGKKE